MKRKDFLQTLALILVLVIGLSLLLYPTVSNWWNSKVQSYAMSNYESALAVLDNELYDQMLQDARAFNESLLSRRNQYALDEEQKVRYSELLDVDGTGIMGYVEVPAINQSIPIYHGTDEAILQIAVGHLEWTSLPVGGASTHCALSGHRGLPSARLFTDLDKIVVGDDIILHIMDEILTYEVDQIKIVEPHVVDDLLVEEGKDLITLVTCAYHTRRGRFVVVAREITDTMTSMETETIPG